MKALGPYAVKIHILLLTLVVSIPQVLAAPAPIEVVETGTQKVLQALEKHQTNTEVRRQAIRKIVDEYFNFDDMAKRSIGPVWNDQPPGKQREFVESFSQFLFNVYIDKIEKYTGEKITYDSQQVEGDFASVKAVVHGYNGTNVPIIYRLQRKGGSWKAYDVVVDGIDLVNNYRSQFGDILSRHSFDYLLKLLKEKNAQSS
ncbi:MAG: ABC transporter substrate-binding protein [Desulfoferrobacter sp.]